MQFALADPGTLRHNAHGDLATQPRGILMGRFHLNASEFALILILSAPLFGQTPQSAPLETDIKSARRTQEEGMKKSNLMKPHFANGNLAMQDAQAIRQQLQTATNDQKTPLLAKMNADYRTAITEYEEALKETQVRDEDGLHVIGLIGVIRNGLVTQQKAVEMLVQDKDLPVILSNLGLAHSGVGEYQEAITMLQQAAMMKPAAGTYMELGTDFAQVGKMPEGIAACDKILSVDPAAKNMQAGCYKNVAIVLTNKGKLADAIAPLQKATQLNPQDALAWKLLGDALTNTITSKSEDGKMVYVIPPGTIEAYQRYLRLDPNGPYAGQVHAAVEGLTKLTKAPTETR